MKGFAKCNLVNDHGVQCFHMEINGDHYGSYPLNGGEQSVRMQIQDAVKDAKEYGYEGICFN